MFRRDLHTILKPKYFITFDDGGSRIELMYRPDIAANSQQRGFVTGIAHLAITVGDRQRVNEMIARFREEAMKSLESHE